MVRVQKCMFLGPKSQFLAKKSDFCHTTPILIDGPFVALGEAVHFQPWERFSDFSFWSNSSFRKKKPADPSKSHPLPTVGAPSASNSTSTLSAQALRARALRARDGQYIFFVFDNSSLPPGVEVLSSSNYQRPSLVTTPPL